MPDDDKTKNTDLTGNTSDGGNVTGETGGLNANTVSPPPTPPITTSSASTTAPPPISETSTTFSPPPPVSTAPGTTGSAPPPPPPSMGSQSNMSGTPLPGTPQNTGEPSKMITTPSGGSKKKFGKKSIIAVLGGLLLIGGVAAGVLLVQQQQDIREEAAFVKANTCISPKGIQITTTTTGPGDVGTPDMLYKPLPGSYSPGEKVDFRVQIKNTTDSAVTDSYFFNAYKIVEAPPGQTPAPGMTEQDMADIHQGPGTIQQEVYNSGPQNLTLAAGEERFIEWSWAPTECAYYQIDMWIDDFTGLTGPECPGAGLGVIAAGFTQMLNCDQAPIPISGNVYCQDPGGQQYPVSGANFWIHDGAGSTYHQGVTTDAQGAYSTNITSNADGTNAVAVQLKGFNNPDSTLSSGQPYTSMIPSSTVNADDFALYCSQPTETNCELIGVGCGDSSMVSNHGGSSSYANCRIASGGTYNKFDFRFTNCSTDEPPVGTGMCQDISAYTVDGDVNIPGNWTKLTAADLTKLSAGDKVYFTVRGWSRSEGVFDMARFKINGTTRTEVITKPPDIGSPEDSTTFYDVYTIPAAIEDFTVNAQIHHTNKDLGWIPPKL